MALCVPSRRITTNVLQSGLGQDPAASCVPKCRVQERGVVYDCMVVEGESGGSTWRSHISICKIGVKGVVAEAFGIDKPHGVSYIFVHESRAKV